MVERQEVHPANRRPALLLIVVYMAVMLTFGASILTNRGPGTYGRGAAPCYFAYTRECPPMDSTCAEAFGPCCRQPVCLQLFGRRFIILFDR